MKKWERTNTGDYVLNGYRIAKTPSGRITKGYGWDVRKGWKRIAHTNTLKEAKAYAESLIKD